MIFEIKHRFTGAVLFSLECGSLKLCVEAAVKQNADLSSANLRYADLRYADLRYADLRYADLRYADLRYANLRYADLSSADLRSANLRSANLSSAKNADYAIACTQILPAGSLIGWKKLGDGSICKVRIPDEARRSHAFGRKCRAEYVDVIEGEGVSIHDGVTKYAPGLRVACDKWDEDYTQECSGGIHFYITKEEAEAHT